MSKARKLADLLTSSGDVKTDHLDNATYSDATTSAKGLMASGDKSKLDGIETGAKADQTKADIDALGINASTVNSKTVATNVPSGAVFTDTNTTYSVGDGGLTQKNFTTTLNTKLDNIAPSANNYSHPATHPASMLTGALPAIDGSSLTGIDALPTQTGHTGKYLGTDGSTATWNTLDTDANSTTKGLYEHANTISANYSISSGSNALTAGPITINTGVSVSIPSGSTWVIA